MQADCGLMSVSCTSHPATVREVLGSVRAGRPDLRLVTAEGEVVETHSLLLSLHSGLLRSLLEERTWLDLQLGLAVSVPLTSATLTSVLRLLDTGEFSYNSSEGGGHLQLSEAQEAAEILGIDMDIVMEEPAKEKFLKSIWKKGKTIKEENTGKEDQAFECDFCGKKMSRGHKLNEHINREHTEISCKYCQQTFTKQLKLIKHLRTDHKNQHLQEYAEFQCDFCDKFLSRKDHLRRHILKVHSQ